MIRDDVVRAVIAGIGTYGGDGFGQLLDSATGEEIHAAIVRLRDAALRPTPDVLEFTLPQLATLAAQGRSLEWIGEQLPAWRSWPGRSLADMLKTAEPWRVAKVRDALRRSGLAVDMGPMGEADDDGLDNESARRRVGAAGLGGSTTAPTSGRGRHRRQGTAPDRGEPAVPHPGPCVCVTGQPCLLHYDRMNQREQARILARLGVRYRSASYIPMPDSKSRIATSPRRTASAKISRIGRASSVLNSAMVRRI